jgi:hypothetical protein
MLEDLVEVIDVSNGLQKRAKLTDGAVSGQSAYTGRDVATLPARRRIAAFFGFEHAPPPKPEALIQFLEICPAPALGGQFVAHERIIGRIRNGPAADVVVEWVEGVVGRTPVAMCAMQFGGKAFGVGALLDNRVQSMDRSGLEGMEVSVPSAYRHLSGFAENQDVADRLMSDKTLSAFAEICQETSARAVNLAVVDDAARMYFALTEPVFAVGNQTPNTMSVGYALHVGVVNVLLVNGISVINSLQYWKAAVSALTV